MVTIISTFSKDDLRVALANVGSQVGVIWRKAKLSPINLKLHSSVSEANSTYSDLVMGFGSIAHESFMDMKELITRRPEFSGTLVGFIDDYDDWETPNPQRSFETRPETDNLKVKCYYCQIDIYAFHRYDWTSKKYEIDINCGKCGRKDVLKITADNIKLANEGGGWQAFLGK